ncbi:MAG TPA: sulfotransferase [Candidatus Binatia bacterium]|nr:sulfotransferase [Candidatus Binatia bacterium]
MTLPNFMIIGVAKAGTTSLFRYLDQHPQVFMCPEKGTNFFGYEDARAWNWADEGDPPLLQHFQVKTFEAYEAMFAGATNEIAIGEVSPQYFRCPTAARRIHERIPDVKLVASLRNPADRAFSGFLMRTRRGEAVKGFWEELTPEASHVKEGFYYKRMKRYFDIFPRHQIKIYIFEEFRKDPAKVVVDLFEFLGVGTNFVPDTSTRHNPAGVPKFRLLNRLFFDPTLIRIAKSVLPESLQQMAKRVQQQNLKTPPKPPADLRANLLDLYREDILKLEALLDRDLSIWLNGT